MYYITYTQPDDNQKYFTFASGRNDFIIVIETLKKLNCKVFAKSYNLYN